MIDFAVIAMAVRSVAPQLPENDVARYANDIAYAALDEQEGLALVAIAEAESRFRPEIERCQCRPFECDGGRASSIFQMHAHWFYGHKRSDVCRYNALATALAARAIRTLKSRTGGSMVRAMRAYVGCRATDIRVVRRVRRFEQLMAQARKAA